MIDNEALIQQDNRIQLKIAVWSQQIAKSHIASYNYSPTQLVHSIFFSKLTIQANNTKKNKKTQTDHCRLKKKLFGKALLMLRVF